MSAPSPTSSNTTKRQSLKRPLIKIRPKKRASKKEISSNTKRKTDAFSTCYTSLSSSSSSSLSSSLRGSSSLPSILTKQYSANDNRGDGNNAHKRNDVDDDNDYNDDPIFAAMLESYVQETMDDVHEVMLTMESLISRYTAAICPFATENNNGYIPFVLKPMIQHALHSTTTCSNSSNIMNTTSKLPTLSQLSKQEQVQRKNNNHLSSAYIATELDVDLNQLDSENKIRMIQLHGITMVKTTGKTDNDGGNKNSYKDNETIDNDQNIAILFMKDYIDGIYDAQSADAAVQCSSSNNDISLETKHDNSHRNEFIMKLFIDCVQHHGCKGLYVTKNKLCSAFESALMKYKNEVSTTIQATSKTIDAKQKINNYVHQYECQPEQWIDYLIHIQLLLPRSSTSYFFTLPKMGMAARAIMGGRTKIVRRIQRSYNKEIRRKTLEQMTINLNGKKLSCMTGSFHVRDLIVGGVLKTVKRPSGEFITFAKK